MLHPGGGGITTLAPAPAAPIQPAPQQHQKDCMLELPKVPPPKEKGGHTKVIYRLPEQWISMGDPVTLAPPRGVKAKAAHPQIP